MNVTNTSAPDLTAFSLASLSANLPSIVDTFGESFILGGNLLGARAKMMREWPALRAWLQNSTPHAPARVEKNLDLVKALLTSVTVCKTHLFHRVREWSSLACWILCFEA